MFKHLMLLLLLSFSAGEAHAGFLIFPLKCGDAGCNFLYNQGPYTYGVINTVLDHSMKLNGSGFYPYGTTQDKGGDGVVVAFNGERANGPAKGTSSSNIVCIGGSILLKPTPTSPASTAMTNTSGCGSGYASYDEHPAYDYKAAYGTSVWAAYGGNVLNLGGQPCYIGNMGSTCQAWGCIGIDHHNGYVTQYCHLSAIFVKAGQAVNAGANIGQTGSTAPSQFSLGPHLHFEVFKVVNGKYYDVDPYGWVGAGADPLYSATVAPPAKLWQ